MATIPIYDRQTVQETGASEPRMPVSSVNPLSDVGTGLLDLAETVRRIQNGADIAEEGKLRREAAASMEAVVKDAAIKYSDPTEFNTVAMESLKTVHDNALDSASNDRVRLRLRANLGDDLITRQTDIRVNTHLKNISKAEGDWTTLKMDALQQYNATDDPVEKSRISRDLQTTLAGLTNNNLIKYDAAKKEIAVLAEQMSEINVRHDWKADPIGTLAEMDKPGGKYSRVLMPDKLEQIKTHLAESYRIAQADVRRKVAEDQDNNFADNMVKARNSQITQEEIDHLASYDPVTQTRAINAEQAVHLTNQLKATMASGGVLYSDPKILSDMQYRLHRGSLNAEEVRRTQMNGRLTIGDANELYTGIEGRVRRDRTEAREVRTEARLNDVGNDPAYKRAEAYITKALPNTDKLDMDHSFRIMVGQAFSDFDQAARATNAEGKPKYGTKDLQGIAENIVEGTLTKMELGQSSARAKLLPGIKTPEDVAAAVRNKNLTPEQAREQMRWLLMTGALPTTVSPKVSTPGASRGQSAQERARAAGAP